MLAWVYRPPGRRDVRALGDGRRRRRDQPPGRALGRRVLARPARVLPRPRHCRLPLPARDHRRRCRRHHGRVRRPGLARIPAASQPEAARFIATQAGFSPGSASRACSSPSCSRGGPSSSRGSPTPAPRLLRTRSRRSSESGKALAEALHDHAIQNLLSARHELQEAGETLPHPALARADDRARRDRRPAPRSRLRPPPVRARGGRARGGAPHGRGPGGGAGRSLELTLDLRYGRRATRRSSSSSPPPASCWRTSCATPQATDADSSASPRTTAELELVVADDGARISARRAAGAARRRPHRPRHPARPRRGGRGSMDVVSAPGAGTRVEIRLPDSA